jgi:hypothetical protein
MRIAVFWKPVFILLLFVGAAWSATLWPSQVIVEITKPLIDGIIVRGEYLEVLVLDGVEVHSFNDDEFLFIGLRSASLGWVALGISPVELHSGANFLFGAVVDGETLVSDQFGSGRYEHNMDTSLGGTSDIVEYAGAETSGTVIELRIPLDSRDVYDTFLEAGKIYSIIVAYHESEDDFQMKHTARFHHFITIH